MSDEGTNAQTGVEVAVKVPPPFLFGISAPIWHSAGAFIQSPTHPHALTHTRFQIRPLSNRLIYIHQHDAHADPKMP